MGGKNIQETLNRLKTSLHIGKNQKKEERSKINMHTKRIHKLNGSKITSLLITDELNGTIKNFANLFSAIINKVNNEKGKKVSDNLLKENQLKEIYENYFFIKNKTNSTCNATCLTTYNFVCNKVNRLVSEKTYSFLDKIKDRFISIFTNKKNNTYSLFSLFDEECIKSNIPMQHSMNEEQLKIFSDIVLKIALDFKNHPKYVLTSNNKNLQKNLKSDKQKSNFNNKNSQRISKSSKKKFSVKDLEYVQQVDESCFIESSNLHQQLFEKNKNELQQKGNIQNKPLPPIPSEDNHYMIVSSSTQFHLKENMMAPFILAQPIKQIPIKPLRPPRPKRDKIKAQEKDYMLITSSTTAQKQDKKILIKQENNIQLQKTSSVEKSQKPPIMPKPSIMSEEKIITIQQKSQKPPIPPKPSIPLKQKIQNGSITKTSLDSNRITTNIVSAKSR